MQPETRFLPTSANALERTPTWQPQHNSTTAFGFLPQAPHCFPWDVNPSCSMHLTPANMPTNAAAGPCDMPQMSHSSTSSQAVQHVGPAANGTIQPTAAEFFEAVKKQTHAAEQANTFQLMPQEGLFVCTGKGCWKRIHGPHRHDLRCHKSERTVWIGGSGEWVYICFTCNKIAWTCGNSCTPENWSASNKKSWQCQGCKTLPSY